MSIVIFILALVILILVHELGHFLAAKSIGVRVNEFGIGFPPRIFGWKPKRGETTYSINWIPFGGFVRIFGEDPEEEGATHNPRSLLSQSRIKQIWVLIAGVLFNALLAWGLITVGYLSGLPTAVTPTTQGLVTEPALTILAVEHDSPAERAGIKPGDEILFVESPVESLQGDELTPDALTTLTHTATGDVRLLLSRKDTEPFSLSITPEKVGTESQAIGVYLETIAIVKLPIHRALFEGLRDAGHLLVTITRGLGSFIAEAFRGEADVSTVVGPVGLSQIFADASAIGFASVLSLSAIISLHLTILNLIPFPALDGGRILIVLLEAIRRKQFPARIIGWINTVGFVLLILLMIVVTIGDISRLFG